MDPKDTIINNLLQQIGSMAVQLAQERAQTAAAVQGMQTQIAALTPKPEAETA